MSYYWAVAFAILALIAALFGFTAIAPGVAMVSQVSFFIFLAAFAVALIAGLARGDRWHWWHWHRHA